MRLSDINNKTISVTLTDIELAKPEDNAPEKLAERVMSDNKIQITTNGIKRPEWLDSDNKQLLGDIDMTITTTCNKDWIYHSNGEIRGRCIMRPMPDSEFGGDDE